MKEKQNDLVTISRIAHIFGVHPDTIRDWTEKGLLNAVRTMGGHRRYSLSETLKVAKEVRNGKKSSREMDQN